jgi:hypothetical protein
MTVTIEEILHTVEVQEESTMVEVSIPAGEVIEVQEVGAIGPQGPQGEVGPPPTGVTINSLTTLATALEDGDFLVIFDSGDLVTRKVRLDVLKTYFNS